MAYAPAPRKDGLAVPEMLSQWHTTLISGPKTPNSKKKKDIYEDVVYISKCDLKQEIKGFIMMLVSRRVIKEADVASYTEYLKKSLENISVEPPQIEKPEESTDFKSPEHKKSPSMLSQAENHLKLRNIQLERDRSAYEEKLQKHGNYISDLEAEISKLIDEYKKIIAEKTELELELDDFRKHFLLLDEENNCQVAKNEEILMKNAVFKRDIEAFQIQVRRLEQELRHETQARQEQQKAIEAMGIVQKEKAERKGAVEQLESEKGRLLREIGGLIDNIRLEKEEDSQAQEQEQVEKRNNQNALLIKEIREKDSVIHMLKEEGERLAHESQSLKEFLHDQEEKHIKEAQRLRSEYREQLERRSIELQRLQKEYEEKKEKFTVEMQYLQTEHEEEVKKYSTEIQRLQTEQEEKEVKHTMEIQRLQSEYEKRIIQEVVHAIDSIKEEHQVLPRQDVHIPLLDSAARRRKKAPYPQITVSDYLFEQRGERTSLDVIIYEPGQSMAQETFDKSKNALTATHEDLACIDDTCQQSTYSVSYHDSIRKQKEDYRTSNILLQKKVESYYIQIEELNDCLKITNENLDIAQNRCITLHRELENKANLETLVQSLLALISKLESKIERLVDENVQLQRVNQENVVLITMLKGELEGDINLVLNRNEPILTQDVKDLTLNSYIKESASLENEFAKRDYEVKIKKVAEDKQMEIEEERIRNKNQMDRYNAHLDVLSKKVQSLVNVNEGLGKDLEVVKHEFANYKVVVSSILQEVSNCISNLNNHDLEIQALINNLSEGAYSKNTEVMRLKEVYGIFKQDIFEAEKLLEERKLLV